MKQMWKKVLKKLFVGDGNFFFGKVLSEDV